MASDLGKSAIRPILSYVASHRPDWKGPRTQVNVKLTPEGKRMLKALARQAKLPIGEYLDGVIRELYGKR